VRPHRQNVISLHKVATFDLLGMTGNDWECWEVWPRVWDSLLYLFLVSSSDTCRQLSRWIGPRSFSFAPVSFSFYPLLESNLNHPRSAGLILRKFADDSAFVVTTAAWEIPFLSASSANYAKLPRSPIFSARNLGKC